MPPLELDVLLQDADGHQSILHSDTQGPADRPTNLRFTSRRGEGHATGSCELARRIDRDWPDLGLYDTVIFAGREGSTGWEGRLARPGRNMDQGHRITLEAVGWAAHLRDQKMSWIGIDRDLSRWHGMSLQRRAALITRADPYTPRDHQVADDVTEQGRALITEFEGTWALPLKPICEAWYDAGPLNRIGRVRATAERGATIDGTDNRWFWTLYVSESDGNPLGGQEASGNLRSTATSRQAEVIAGGARRYGLVQHLYDSTGQHGVEGAKYTLNWRNLRVIGDHGLPLIGTAPHEGLAASDVRRHIITTWCPRLNPAGITPTSYPIAHLVFADRTHPYDGLLEVGKYDLHELAVWDERTVHTGPADLTDHDWEIRLDDPGTTVQLQGDSTEDLANGIEVTYQDVNTGRTELLHPDTHPQLRDTDADHPANRHGLKVITSLELRNPASRDNALDIGRLVLAETNQPKGPGTITAGPYLRDRQGNFQPAWRARALDTLAITSSTSLSDRPRLIGEASYDHDQRKITMAVDSTLARADAIQDRITTALQARGLI
jgi:hypothetical protein